MERFHLLLAIVMFGGFFCNGQMVEKIEGVLTMENIFDQNEEILKHLKGQQDKLTTLEEMQRIITDTLRDQHTENQLCAKQDQLEDFKNTYESGTEEFKASLELSSCTDQLLDFQEMLANDECEARTDNCSPSANCTDQLILYKCDCLPGYFGDGFTCTDIDECQRGQHQCQSPKTCINIDGSYECQCTPPYIRDGESCKNDCESPSLHLDGLGCVTLIQTWMNWTEARAECKRLGLRLLEDLKVEHLSPLDLHFTPLRSSRGDSWIGFRDKTWVTSGHSVASELLAVGERGELEDECGTFDIRRNTTNFGLWDVTCTRTYDALCQTIP